MQDPFAPVSPHALARRAAEALQRSLRVAAGLGALDLAGLERPGRGKMFGVLVASDASGRVGYLSGFSGMLDGRWHVDGFVPPLFDTAARDAFWPACEEEWRSREAQVSALANGDEARELRRALEEQEVQHAAEKESLRARHAQNRRLRQEERRRLKETTPGAPAQPGVLHALGQQSRADEVEQRKLFARHRAERALLLDAQRALDARRLAIEQQRADRSREVWRRVTDGYLLPNARGQVCTLTSLYDPRPVPGGAGDCAGPKLLGHAYRHGLRPLALAEFWWGAAPLTGDRVAGAYYPACQSKCGRVLPWMLQGLPVAAEAPSVAAQDA